MLMIDTARAVYKKQLHIERVWRLVPCSRAS